MCTGLAPKRGFKPSATGRAFGEIGRGGLPGAGAVAKQIQLEKAEAKRLEAEAAARQEEMNRLAAERQAAAEAQQAELIALQAQSEQQDMARRQQVAGLQAQQAERIGTIRARGMAVSQSLRILGQAGSQQAPTAAVAPKPKNAKAAKTAAASLRMGSTSQGTGSGVNIAV